MKRVCATCHGYYTDTGLTGEIWQGESGVSHGYCPECEKKALDELEES